MSDQYIERRIIVGLITSHSFVNEFASLFKSEYFISKTAQTIARWCISYQEKYEKAPQSHIQDIYFRKIQDLDKDTAEWIEDVLESLSDDFAGSDLNIDYLKDETEKYFKQRSIVLFAEEIQDDSDRGDVLEAESKIAKFNSPQRLTGGAFDPLSAPPELHREAFEQSSDSFVKYPGALGEHVSPEMTRESFVAFMGPDKVGKTSLLFDTSYRAASQGKNVAFFEAGDMTQRQLLRRQGLYLLRRSDKPQYCSPMFVPVLDCFYNQVDMCKNDNRESDCGVFEELRPGKGEFGKCYKEVFHKSMQEVVQAFEDAKDYKPCKYCSKYNPKRFVGAVWYRWRDKVDPITWREAYKAGKRFKEKCKSSNIRWFIYPADTLRIADIKNELAIVYKQEGWAPDIIITDYPDLMLPDDPKKEGRDAIDNIWKRHRNLSQEMKCLVVTVTQSDADAYTSKTLSRKNFSEDKRKFAHVTAFFGINQTEEEKAKGVFRLNRLVAREDYFDSKQQVKVLSKPEIGRFVLESFL